MQAAASLFRSQCGFRESNFVEKAGRGRACFVSPDETIAVLRNAYECGQPAATTRAHQVRNLLLSLGYHGFREVGPPDSSTPAADPRETSP